MLVHRDNLVQKEQSNTKYSDEKSKLFLAEIRQRYEEWHSENMSLIGPKLEYLSDDEAIIKQRVELLNNYKDFIDQQKYAEHFDSRSNLHSTILEEFLYYLFKDLVIEFGSTALIGKSHAFKDIFFTPSSYEKMVKHPHARIETKDHDFIIGIRIEASLKTGFEEKSEIHYFDIPAVVIECKTYLDKTMLEGSATSANQLKAHNPNAIYIVMMEWVKLTESVNLQKYSIIDQLYVIRKQKNTDRELRYIGNYQKNPIFADVIYHLFNTVRNHLSIDWDQGVEFGLKRGWLI